MAVLAVTSAQFQSRNREAFHFRLSRRARYSKRNWFQSRNREAFHFRRNRHVCNRHRMYVSISQSRGFSFQGIRTRHSHTILRWSFNLAIERLFISGGNRTCIVLSVQRRFNLAIERLFISGATAPMHGVRRCRVSISQSRGFSFQDKRATEGIFGESFQSRNREAFHFRNPCRLLFPIPTRSFNLAIERLFISGKMGQAILKGSPVGFNLAIERLFISGRVWRYHTNRVNRFQSRNREAFHFRETARP